MGLMLMTTKIGRPAKSGARTATGQLSRAKAAIAKGEQPSQWARIRDELLRKANDPYLGSELGRMLFHERITTVQFESGRRYAETVQKCLRTIGLRCVDPGDKPGAPGNPFPSPGTPQWDDMTDAGRAASATLREFNSLLGANKRAVEHVAIFGLHLEYEQHGKLVAGLDALTAFFNSAKKRRQ